MQMRVMAGLAVAAMGVALAVGGRGFAQAPPAPDGAAIFAQRCASCHDKASGHTPTHEALTRRGATNVLMALTAGAMKPMAAGMSAGDIAAVGAYLAAEGAAKTEPLLPNPCKGPRAALGLSGPAWNGWGRDHANTRFQPAPGLATADVPRLKLKWAFAYPGLMAWGQPTVVGGRVFVTSSGGEVYALDAETGCTLWTFQAGAPVRTALTIGKGRAGPAAYFGDMTGGVYAVDADTGHQLWRIQADDHPATRITAAPVLDGDRLYVPVSSGEEGSATQPTYACCTFRGSVEALDAMTGKVIWKTYTLPEKPKPYRLAGDPRSLYGPAGGSVWNTPTIDHKRGALYVGDGNDYTDVDAPTTDSVLALNLADGKIRWSRQMLKRDHWAAGCTVGGPCPKNAGPDYDLSASVILVHTKAGKDVLVASNKGGEVFGLDPDTRGKLLWRAKFGTGGIFGGVEWGMASNGSAVFVPVSDSLPEGGPPKPGLGALDPATGRTLWWIPASKPACSWGETECRGALSQAASAIPGIVFAGSHDGHLRAYRAGDGKVVWDVDTAAPVKPVNARSASGGSLDAGGPTVAGGALYVNSGYGQFLGRGGNVLLAYSVDGR
jgi:polyvinyl alcohol dehydrogenase (cytochrome)